jgi:hypothetical protein
MDTCLVLWGMMAPRKAKGPSWQLYELIKNIKKYEVPPYYSICVRCKGVPYIEVSSCSISFIFQDFFSSNVMLSKSPCPP